MGRSSVALVALFFSLADASSSFKIVRLTEAAKKGAVCLDGSAPAYYIRPGNASHKWLIHHEGGGWCEGWADCVSRSKTTKGSSNTYADTYENSEGYFSQSRATNPTLYDWNHVFLRYCDGASFAGNYLTDAVAPDGTVLHFRGKLVREAMAQSLFDLDLGSATDVVINGGSAGALAALLSVDQWCDAISAESPAVKCVGMPDSGFFLDFQDPRAKPFTTHEYAEGERVFGKTNPGNYHAGLKWSFESQNASGGVNQKCIAFEQKAGEEYRCMFAEHVSKWIRTPVFVLQSKYDSWQTAHVLYDHSTASVNQLGRNITERLTSSLVGKDATSGAFLDACHHHCHAWNSIRIDGDLVSAAFASWYETHDDPSAKKLWNATQSYPCDECCEP